MGSSTDREVVLFADTFNTNFDPEILDAAIAVLTAADYRIHLPRPIDGARRPLCCVRTLLAAGQVHQAKAELQRLLDTLAPFVARDIPIVGLEPSCLLTLRDELPALLCADERTAPMAANAVLIEEFLATEADNGRLKVDLKPRPGRALLHGHCHQKAFGAMGAVERCLGLIPELAVETITSSCCGMAGAFGYQTETYEISMQMAELSLLPAVRKADTATLIVADGTSCRHQIAAGSGRQALHVVQVLAASLP